jgi:phosphatidylglycerol---prolipoprotein diacylglyceryl transferase
MLPLPRSTAYGWLMLAGIGFSIVLWSRVARRDSRLVAIYIAALCGAFLGAKLVYVAAEGWMHFGAPDVWLQLATGKSILGALLGGYVAVECAKKATGYARATGDWFALIAPAGIALGRVGCLLHGCCLGEVCAPAWFTLRDGAGVDRWPAVPVEIAFNVAFLIFVLSLRPGSGDTPVAERARSAKHATTSDPGLPSPRRWMANGDRSAAAPWLTGQHFHLYLIAYGIFRFAHEFARATPRVFGVFSGYQIAALAVATLGAIGFARRRTQSASHERTTAQRAVAA